MNLPNEIYLQIFNLLDKPTIINCVTVCKDWTLPAFRVYYKDITINEDDDALYLPQSVECLDIIINEIDLYDWIDEVGIDNALKLAEFMSKLSSAFLEWLSCAASFSDFRSVHNFMKFSGEYLSFYHGLNYADLFDDSGEEPVLELAVPDRTISVVGLKVINDFLFLMCIRHTELAFKLLKYSLINCPHLQSLAIIDLHSPPQEYILSTNSIDVFRKGVKKYDPSTVLTGTSKVVKLKGFIPSQECLDLLSCYLPDIQILTCGIGRRGRSNDSEVPQNYVVDLTQFKSLQKSPLMLFF
ncbi:hypothetical protein EDC94DRAFT_655405 [Helicostylum pulchrum]|nr:hypothetical protein EDC94DRAFT_655405 [Helicostylum pulchrum]